MYNYSVYKDYITSWNSNVMVSICVLFMHYVVTCSLTTQWVILYKKKTKTTSPTPTPSFQKRHRV